MTTTMDAHKPPLFRRSPETSILVERLCEAKIDEVLRYDELSELIGADVRRDASSTLYSARRIALNEHRRNFEAIRNVGLVRTNPEQTITASQAVLQRVNRASKQGAKKLATLEFSELPEEQKRRYTAAMSLHGVIGRLSRRRAITRLELRCENRPEMAFARTIELAQKLHGRSAET